jgi:hypothetical protein
MAAGLHPIAAPAILGEYVIKGIITYSGAGKELPGIGRFPVA